MAGVSLGVKENPTEGFALYPFLRAWWPTGPAEKCGNQPWWRDMAEKYRVMDGSPQKTRKFRTLDPVEAISAQLRCNIKPFELIVAFWDWKFWVTPPKNLGVRNNSGHNVDFYLKLNIREDRESSQGTAPPSPPLSHLVACFICLGLFQTAFCSWRNHMYVCPRTPCRLFSHGLWVSFRFWVRSLDLTYT